MKRISLLAPALTLSLLLTACGAGGGSPDASPGDGGDGPIDHPGDAELVLSVEYRGGFVPAEFLATQLPAFVMLGDGTLLTQGAVPAIFPGPLLTPLLARTLTEEGIQAVLAEVAATNLFTGDLELRGAQNFVADAPDTVFILHAGGREVTISVYALGLVDPSTQPPQGMSGAEIAAHQVLRRLLDRLQQPETWLPDAAFADDGWHAYEPDAFRLYVRDATGDVPDASGIPSAVRPWPIDGDPATFGEEDPFFGDGTRCGVVTGADAAAWLADLTAANALTRWSADGPTRYAVTPRALLPYEERSCPELGGGA